MRGVAQSRPRSQISRIAWLSGEIDPAKDALRIRKFSRQNPRPARRGHGRKSSRVDGPN